MSMSAVGIVLKDSKSAEKSNELNKKQDLLLKPLSEFYSKKGMIARILPIVNGVSNISLRIIDWFVTNYSKKNNVAYSTKTKEQFIVFLEYKAQLKAYSKKQFDPFCRRNRILFPISETSKIETTVGQLNFFRWAIENKVLDYIQENYTEIEKDMNDSIKSAYKEKQDKKEKQSNKEAVLSVGNTIKEQLKEIKAQKKKDEEEKKRKKRQELSISATKTLNKHNVKILVDFG